MADGAENVILCAVHLAGIFRLTQSQAVAHWVCHSLRLR